MPFNPFSFEQHKQFLLDTLRTKMPQADLSPGSFWQIWSQGQAYGLSGLTSALTTMEQQLLPDHATGMELDHHAQMYDIPRKLPQKAVGRVRITLTEKLENTPLFATDTVLYLKDVVGRKYDLLYRGTVGSNANDQLTDPTMAGLYDIDVIAREPGEDYNQSEDAYLYFYQENTTTGVSTSIDEIAAHGLENIATVIGPGLTGGHGLETDPQLSARIINALAEGRFLDNVEHYKKWILDCHARTRQENGDYLGTDLDDVYQAFAYRDSVVPNRVYVMALNPPPNRIGSGQFLQAVFNAVEASSPVTVDPIVPVIEETEIDLTVCVEPRAQARWDWQGVKIVDHLISDKKIALRRGYHPDLSTPTEEHLCYNGAEGLEPGMRVMIGGEQRTVGHIDWADDNGTTDIISLTEDLRSSPDQSTPVYPGGMITDQIHETIARLFDTLGPLHKVLVPADGKHNVLVSVITDSLMEIEDVHDASVPAPELLINADLLANEEYAAGLLAYLPVPGRISVLPIIESETEGTIVVNGIPSIDATRKKIK